MKKTLIKSYAKINLSLNVLGKNRSNLHRIEGIVSFLDFHDKIYIQSRNNKNHLIQFSGKFSKNLKKNTILQLLQILDKKKLLKNKYKIQIIKNIPQRAGLGGGSMNAASLLNYFVKKKIIKLSKKETLLICNKIGSDVFLGLDRKNSFLINHKYIRKYNIKIGLIAVLIKPKIGCSTKKIYMNVKNYSKRSINITSKILNIQNLKQAENDLEIPAFKLYPILKKLKIFLSNINQVEFVRMTGSGSTIVAYFSNKKSAINALKLIRKKFKNYWSILSKTI